ncbi:hypothetical protein REPUB_Repub19eG0048800 [Reevesia pubescens]
MHNKESLCFKVLQARYFRFCSPMHVDRSANASYLWQSLLKGRDIINIGAHLRVGDGIQLDVWRDKWLCNPLSYKVTYNEIVTPKTKFFMWKVFHNILPTTWALLCRGISVIVACSTVCEAQTASTFHIDLIVPLVRWCGSSFVHG